MSSSSENAIVQMDHIVIDDSDEEQHQQLPNNDHNTTDKKRKQEEQSQSPPQSNDQKNGSEEMEEENDNENENDEPKRVKITIITKTPTTQQQQEIPLQTTQTTQQEQENTSDSHVFTQSNIISLKPPLTYQMFKLEWMESPLPTQLTRSQKSTAGLFRMASNIKKIGGHSQKGAIYEYRPMQLKISFNAIHLEAIREVEYEVCGNICAENVSTTTHTESYLDGTKFKFHFSPTQTYISKDTAFSESDGRETKMQIKGTDFLLDEENNDYFCNVFFLVDCDRDYFAGYTTNTRKDVQLRVAIDFQQSNTHEKLTLWSPEIHFFVGSNFRENFLAKFPNIQHKQITHPNAQKKQSSQPSVQQKQIIEHTSTHTPIPSFLSSIIRKNPNTTQATKQLIPQTLQIVPRPQRIRLPRKNISFHPFDPLKKTTPKTTRTKTLSAPKLNKKATTTTISSLSSTNIQNNNNNNHNNNNNNTTSFSSSIPPCLSPLLSEEVEDAMISNNNNNNNTPIFKSSESLPLSTLRSSLPQNTHTNQNQSQSFLERFERMEGRIFVLENEVQALKTENKKLSDTLQGIKKFFKNLP